MQHPDDSTRRDFLVRTATSLGAAALGMPAFAANAWPDGPVKFILGVAAGGGPDATTRATADTLSQRLKQPFVVENKVGANGALGFQALLSAPADGRTIGYFAQYHYYAMALMKRAELLNDFDFITKTGVTPSLVLVREQSPYTSLAQVLEAARKAPGTLNYASGGIGSPAHVGIAKLLLMTKTDMTQVPYKGGGEQGQALAAGLVDVGFAVPQSVKGLIEGKRVRVLAISSAKRLPSMPEVPTVNEAAGLQGYDMSTWGGYVVRKGVPKEAISAIFTATQSAIKTPRVSKTFNDADSQIDLSTSPEDFARFFEEERRSAAQLVRDLGLTAGS